MEAFSADFIPHQMPAISFVLVLGAGISHNANKMPVIIYIVNHVL